VEGNLNGYTIIMMGDVNGDGKCMGKDINDPQNDADIVARACLLEVDEKTDYAKLLEEELGLTKAGILAANMNNNSTLDSNDAWFIRSKELHWGGEWNKHQIVYRTVLR